MATAALASAASATVVAGAASSAGAGSAGAGAAGGTSSSQQQQQRQPSHAALAELLFRVADYSALIFDAKYAAYRRPAEILSLLLVGRTKKSVIMCLCYHLYHCFQVKRNPIHEPPDCAGG